MKLIIGLGNPEQKYAGTRHNVGFWVIDTLAEQLSASFKMEQKFKALIATATVAGEKVLLVKPQTYYNDVGEAARSAMDFYKLTPNDILVIHDDLALPLGTIRTRVGGSDGGNNGLKSLAAHVGTDTNRMRIGVWTEHHHGADKVGIVLGKLSRDEQATLKAQSEVIQAAVNGFLTNDFVVTTY